MLLLTILILIFKIGNNLIKCQSQSCDTYVHPTYGIGKCVNTARCQYNLYISNLCEGFSSDSNVQCCFSTPTDNCTTRHYPFYSNGQCIKKSDCQGNDQVSSDGYCDGLSTDFTCCWTKTNLPTPLQSCAMDKTRGKGVCVASAQCPNGDIAATSGECSGNDVCCYSLQKDVNYYEFRGIWISTVENIDWPSRPGLTTAQQQTELISILDTMQSVGMNAVVFQIRPAGDALYASKIEPWSYYITGSQGQAPSPFWDPLEFIIREAKIRHIDVHAWLNPLRARNKGATYQFAPNHMSQLYPDVTYNYDGYIWMDPGSNMVRLHTLMVVEDIVRNYDITAIHIDDYFYPYPVAGVDFPDSASYNAYLNSGGRLSLADWRRDNINKLVLDIYTRIKSLKPLVQFGISPFGIWRPGNPAGISGFDQYSEIYADAKLWLNSGWLDYMTPQLYWAIDPPAQSFPKLLQWWCEQNTQNKLVIAGTAAYKLEGSNNWAVIEMERQVNITREFRNISSFGTTAFTANQITRNVKNVANVLKELYSKPALAPFMNV